MNRLAEHERYRYLGHLSETDRKHFAEQLIKDRRTSVELHVECSRLAPDWTTVERANLQILERRFEADLPQLGYDNCEIFLHVRDPHSHPLQKLNRSGVDELARTIKKYLVGQKPLLGEQSLTEFPINEVRPYSPLAEIFRTVRVSKVNSSGTATGDSPVVRVGVIAYEQSELELRLDQAITSKFGRRADILLIYSEGPLFVFDLAKVSARLKESAETLRAHQFFAKIWFLAHYLTAAQKLFQIV